MFALTTDIDRKLQQIRVNQDDTCYQKILNRDNSLSAVKHYTLDPITYGSSCAPFPAVPTVQQVTEDIGTHYQ